MSPLAGLRRDVRAFGPGRILLRGLLKLAYRIVGLRALRAMTLTAETLDRAPITHAGAYDCRLLGPDALRSLAKDPANQMPEAFVEAALVRGDECFAIFDGETLASFGWYARTPTPVVGSLRVRFPATDAYMYHGYTRPDYRGRKLHGIGLAERAALGFERDHFGRLVTVALATNWPSLRSAHRIGYRNVGLVLSARIGGRTRVWSSPGVGRAGMFFERLETRDAVSHQLGA